MPRKVLVLVGGGHAHVQVVMELRAPAVRKVLISDADTALYSGLLPSIVAELRREEEASVDLVALADAYGWEFMRGRAVAINGEERVVSVDGGDGVVSVGFDYLSVDVGSATRAFGGDGGFGEEAASGEHKERSAGSVIATRPIGRLLGLVENFEARALSEAPLRRPRSVLVVGGGAAGCELAFALDARLKRSLASVGGAFVTLVSSGSAIVEQLGSAAGAAVDEEMRKRNIERIDGHVVDVDDANGRLRLDDGCEMSFHALVAATGAAAHQWLCDATDLETDEEGFLLVQPTLQTTRYRNVFAVGDCAAFGGRFGPNFPPRAGVYAVRQGPVLIRNILSLIQNGGEAETKLEEYAPQSSFLSLIATGDGRAIGSKHGIAFKGMWVGNLKRYIDDKWMERFLQRSKSEQKVRRMHAKFTGSASEGAAVIDVAEEVLRSDSFDVQWAVLQRMDSDSDFCAAVVRNFSERVD